MSEPSLPERMRKVALDLPVPDDLTNREYWLRTEILEWADELDAEKKRRQGERLSRALGAMGL